MKTTDNTVTVVINTTICWITARLLADFVQKNKNVSNNVILSIYLRPGCGSFRFIHLAVY